jgi:hypothetical protein
MTTLQKLCNDKADILYKCDKCNKTFKAKEVRLEDAATNIDFLTPMRPLIFVDKDDAIKGGGTKAEAGDRVLTCPYCKEVHLFGFSTVKNIISPTECVHAINTEEPAKQALCNQDNSSFWPHTDKPVTCIRCLNKLNKDTPVSLCLKRIKILERAYNAEMAKFNENIRTECKYYKKYILTHEVRFKRTFECVYYKDNSRQCCIAHCPLG